MRKWLIGQTHNDKGNIASYHAAGIWPCVVSGCSRSRLPIIVAVCAVSSDGQTMASTEDMEQAGSTSTSIITPLRRCKCQTDGNG